MEMKDLQFILIMHLIFFVEQFSKNFSINYIFFNNK